MSRMLNKLSLASRRLGIFIAPAVVTLATVALAPSSTDAQAQFSCTQIIGYSTTNTWFPAAEAQLDSTRWQLLWENGGGAWLWADPGYSGWGKGPDSPCTHDSRSPDRIVMDVATNVYTTDVAQLERDIRNVIATIRLKYPSVRQIMLQPEHGGPNHTTCPWASAPFGVVRATYNHPTIEAAIGRVVGGDIVRGPDPLVRTCSDFADSIGHVTPTGATALGTSNGRFYAGSAPPPPSATPTAAARIPTPLPTVAPRTPTPTPGGSGGSSLSLNGTSAYAQAPDAADVDAVGDWTFEAWFKDETPGGYDHPRTRIATKGDTATNTEVPLFVDITSNQLWVGRRAGGNYQVLGASLAGVTANAWHHMAATFRASTFQVTLYLDGVQVAQGTGSTATAGNSAPVSIGRNGGTTPNFWRGKLDDVRLWNVVRSATDIQGSFRTEFASSPAGLVANWRFREGTGSTAADTAGAPQNATLLGGAGWSTDSPIASGPICPCSLWASTATPEVASHTDTQPVELGVKFRSDIAGSVTGIRFFKGPSNTGLHTANLWTADGTRLATATFTGESATGWQQVTFASPVRINPNTTYIASYFAPRGGYARDLGYFSASGVDRSPLHAPGSNLSGGNGVYRYGSASGFPTTTYQSTNYWVDVLFAP